MKKVLLLILLCFGAIRAYMGDLHGRLMEQVPKHLRSIGQETEADTVEKYMELMKDGSKSPDRDYSEFKIPEDAVPEWLKPITSTSPVKFEHVLVDDVPEEIETLLEKIADFMEIPFRYADEAFIEWNERAKVHWLTGQIDSALWHMSRCCHLIADLTVPMHTKVTGNLIDVWQVLNHDDPNHDKFEDYCSKKYVPGKVEIDSKEEFGIPSKLFEIAEESRSTLRLCDGYRIKLLDFPPVHWIFPFVREDYDKAAKLCTQRAERYTAIYISSFFKKIKAGGYFLDHGPSDIAGKKMVGP